MFSSAVRRSATARPALRPPPTGAGLVPVPGGPCQWWGCARGGRRARALAGGGAGASSVDDNLPLCAWTLCTRYTTRWSSVGRVLAWVAWREEVASAKRASFRDEDLGTAGARLWRSRGRPGSGRPGPRRAAGGNRTGRVFTGDRSGDWVYRALWHAGFTGPTHERPCGRRAEARRRLRDHGREAHPPANKPTPAERAACVPYLERELRLGGGRVIVVLGRFAHDAMCDLLGLRPRPPFFHLTRAELADGRTLISSYHPSQQNTFTGTLTEPAFDAVFARARRPSERGARARAGPFERGARPGPLSGGPDPSGAQPLRPKAMTTTPAMSSKADAANRTIHSKPRALRPSAART